MNWLPQFLQRTNRTRMASDSNSFLTAEWANLCQALAPDRRRAVALTVCREVLTAVPLADPSVERALAVLELGSTDPEATKLIRSLVDRLEGDYDSLLDAHEARPVRESASRLDLGDTTEAPFDGTGSSLDAAFLRARAATTVQNALAGDLPSMVYEAWFALDCHLDQLRNLASMSQSP